MKITLCGSIAFIDQMVAAQSALEATGHEVRLPPLEVPGEDGALIPVKQYYEIRKASRDADAWVGDLKAHAMRMHFDKVAWSDAILVCNYEKNGVPGYIGGNTFMEMGLAFHLGRRIYLMQQVPNLPYREEILGMKPMVIHDNLAAIA